MAEPDAFLQTAARTPTAVRDEGQQMIDRVAPPTERHLVTQARDRSLLNQLRVAGRVWRDPRVRPVPRILMLAALGYLVLPLSVVPRRVGPLPAKVLRPLQQLLVLVVLLWLIVRLTPRHVLREHLDAVE
jgi:hypothetical protein